MNSNSRDESSKTSNNACPGWTYCCSRAFCSAAAIEWCGDDAFIQRDLNERLIGARLSHLGLDVLQFDLAHRVQLRELLIAGIRRFSRGKLRLGLFELRRLQAAIEFDEHLPEREGVALFDADARDLRAQFRRQRRMAAGRQLSTHLLLL